MVGNSSRASGEGECGPDSASPHATPAPPQDDEEQGWLSRRALDALPALISFVDREERYRFVNAAYERWFGQKREEIRGRTLLEILGEEAYARIAPYVRRALAGESLSFRTYLEYKHGGGRMVDVTYAPELDGDAGVIGYFALVEDVSEEVALDARLRASEARYRRLAEATREGVVIHDGERIRDANTVFANMVGLDEPQMVVGRRLADFLPDIEIGADAPGEDTEFHSPRETQMRRLDGAALTVDYVGKWIEVDGRLMRLKSVRDLTGLRRTEKALSESEARFRLVAEQAPVMLWMSDAEARCLYINQALRDFWGVAEEDTLAFDWSNTLHPEDKPDLLEKLTAAMTRRGRLESEARFQRDDGAWRLLHTIAAPRFGPDGEFLGMIGVNADVTERKQAERRLHLLVSELNHRVKNMLAIVQSLAHQSFAGDAPKHEQTEAFRTRLSALAAAHNLLTQASWEQTSLAEIAEATIAALFVHADRVSIHGPKVLLPPKKAVTLAMALHELSTNALKYGALSTEQGRVALSWAWRPETRELTLEWRERGGPPIKEPPSRKGFGSSMIEQALAQELDGDVRMNFQRAGLVCTVKGRLFDGEEPS